MAVLPTNIADGDAGHAAKHNATNAEVNAVNTALTTKLDANHASVTNQRTPLDGSVTTPKLADDAVTEAKLSPAVRAVVTGGNNKDYVSVADAPYNAPIGGVSDCAAVINTALTNLQGTGATLLIPGLAGIASPLARKSEVTLKGTQWTRWPYGSGTTWTPPTGIKVLSGFAGSSAMYFGNGVEHARTEEIYINVGSLPATGTQIAGVHMEGSARDLDFEKVGVLNSTGHGFSSATLSSNTPRGLNFRTCVAYSSGNSTGTNATNTQDGWNMVAFTDCTLIDCEAKDNRRDGFRLSGVGQVNVLGCYAPFNRNGRGLYITGGDATLATGNGGIIVTGFQSDRNYAEGILVDAVGRNLIQISNSTLRRDGSNGETGTPAAAGLAIAGTSTSSRAAPTLLSNVATIVEDDDSNNAFWTCVTGFRFQNLTQVSMVGCYVWGRTNSIVQGSGSTGGLIKQTANWFITGLPTAKTVVNPTIA